MFLKLRAFDIDTDFERIRNWITDEKTHVMWSANRIAFPMNREDFEGFLKRQSEEGDTAFAAVDESGRIVGFFLYGFNEETGEGMLKFIVVDPEQRGKGTAQEMLKLASEYAFEKTHADAVHLNVFSSNPRARRCYEKAGFTERNTTPGAFPYKDEKWDRTNMIMRRKPGFKLAIFDFDGTLMDTRTPIVFAKQETMRIMGLPVLDEEACAATIGYSAKKGFLMMYPDLAEEVADQCVLHYRRIFDETIEKTAPELFPGVEETLSKLKERGIICTIATARNRRSLMSFLERKNIDGFFSYILAQEDTKNLKPDPEPVLKTMKDLGIEKDQTMVIGDMPMDILMGKNAGAYTCGVSYGNAKRDILIDAGADYVIDRISDLLPII